MVQPPQAAQKLRTWFGLKEDFVRVSSTDAVVTVRLFRAVDSHYILAAFALSRRAPEMQREFPNPEFPDKDKNVR